jgi:type I restriction enzyme S subunit
MDNGLTESTLAEVCSLVTDGTHDTPKRVASGFPLIKAKEITGGRIDFENCDQISEEEHLEVIARSKPEFGDTLFAHIGASLGEAAFVNTTREFSIKNVALFKPNPAFIDARYLYYLVISPAFQSLAKGTKTGSAQPFLGLSQLRGHCIQFHRDKATQRRIGAILSAYDELMENSQRRIRLLEAMARALYREWFVHFRFPGHAKHPRVVSPIGDIPEGWEVRKLADFVTTKYGYTESTNVEPVGPKYLRGMDFNKTSFIDWSEVPYCPISLEDHEAYRLRVGDVVVIRMADPGKVGIVEQEVDAVFASYLIRVAPKDSRLSPYFLFYLMESAEYYAFITGASTGTTRKSASAGVIAEYQFVLPPQQVVEQFERRVSEIRSLLTTLLKKTVNLRRTRDLLLPRLLSGQVNLTQEN